MSHYLLTGCLYEIVRPSDVKVRASQFVQTKPNVSLGYTEFVERSRSFLYSHIYLSSSTVRRFLATQSSGTGQFS